MSKRKALSLSDKLQIVTEFENGKSRGVISQQFGVPSSTLCRILKDADNIKKECAEGHGKVKRFRGSEHPDLEKCLVEWLKECRSRTRNVPVNGPILKQKAIEFSKKLGVDDFNPTNGWLDGFKKRNDIVFKNIVGESGAVDTTICNQWIIDLPTLLAGYSPDNVFNADETGLFYQCLPNKTFSFKGESCNGGKHSKVRIALLLGANMSGTEKLPPLLIGKSKNPRCLDGK